MNWVDLLDVVFFVLVGFTIFRFARAAQQKRKNEQIQNEQPLADERKRS